MESDADGHLLPSWWLPGGRMKYEQISESQSREFSVGSVIRDRKIGFRDTPPPSEHVKALTQNKTPPPNKGAEACDQENVSSAVNTQGQTGRPTAVSRAELLRDDAAKPAGRAGNLGGLLGAVNAAALVFDAFEKLRRRALARHGLDQLGKHLGLGLPEVPGKERVLGPGYVLCPHHLPAAHEGGHDCPGIVRHDRVQKVALLGQAGRHRFCTEQFALVLLAERRLRKGRGRLSGAPSHNWREGGSENQGTSSEVWVHGPTLETGRDRRRRSP